MISISFADIEGLKRFDNILKSLGDDMPKVAARAINRTGDMARTQVVRALARQTGLRQKVVRTIVRRYPAMQNKGKSGLVYELRARGYDISLKHFKPRETRRGVTAAPFNKRRLYPRSFLMGGAFPDKRHGLVNDGHVMIRTGKARDDLKRVRSGVRIPDEMLKGATAAAFRASVRDNLPRRVEHEINRILKI
jgi:Prophage minor tail protein Z (GPZ)